MWHDVEDLVAERQRAHERPEPSPDVPYLDALDVELDVDPQVYAANIRAVIRTALGVAVEFAGKEELPLANIPSWFVLASTPGHFDAPDFALSGRDHYLRHAGTGKGWGIQDWLSRLEPDDSMRGWAWWDLTRSGDGRLRIWINAEGEAHYSHLDLLWLAYLSGARQVAYPQGLSAEDWAREESCH